MLLLHADTRHLLPYESAGKRSVHVSSSNVLTFLEKNTTLA